MSRHRPTRFQRVLRRMLVRGRGEVRAMEDAAHLEGILRFAGLPVDASGAPGFEARVRSGVGLSDRARNRGEVWGGEGYAGALAEAERRKLQAWYRPHNLELYAMLQRDFGWENETAPGGGASPHLTQDDRVVVARRLRPEL